MADNRSFWRAHAARERAAKMPIERCPSCGALLTHKGISCEQIAVRLRSVADEYDSSDPWNWPPVDLYREVNWQHVSRRQTVVEPF